jgi:hypothetical protein
MIKFLKNLGFYNNYLKKITELVKKNIQDPKSKLKKTKKKRFRENGSIEIRCRENK